VQKRGEALKILNRWLRETKPSLTVSLLSYLRRTQLEDNVSSIPKKCGRVKRS